MVKPVKRILYFEDEQEMVDLVRLILEREGYTVESAGEGRAGLAVTHQYSPDLILLDLLMPDMDGWEIYHKLKQDEATKDIPVIIITAKAKSIDKVLGSDKGKVNDYIIKPFSPQNLVERVNGILSKHDGLGENDSSVNGRNKSTGL